MFVDKKSRALFAAERVAVDYVYLCANDNSSAPLKRYSRPVKKLSEECRGPYGETFVEGMLAGRRVVAVYSVSKAVPCCFTYSLMADDPKIRSKRLNWLASGDVPMAELGSQTWTIGPDNPPIEPDKGPLRGGEYVPAWCRTP